MKEIIIGVLIMIVSLYLYGSFMNGSFDPNNWDYVSRSMTSFLSLGCIFMGVVLYGVSKQ